MNDNRNRQYENNGPIKSVLVRWGTTGAGVALARARSVAGGAGKVRDIKRSVGKSLASETYETSTRSKIHL